MKVTDRGTNRGLQLIGLTMCTALALAACGTSPTSVRSAAGSSSGTVTNQQLPTGTNYEVDLPEGFESPAALAPATGSGGVWFWSESSSDARLFYWGGPGQSLSSWDLGVPSQVGLVTGIQNAITVGPSGDVWIGANDTLVQFDPTSATLSFVSVPEPTDSSQVENSRPPAIRGLHSIEGLAVNSRGSIAIAMSAAQSIPIYDPASHAFSQLALPTNTSPIGVAYTSDDTLGVALNNAGSPDMIYMNSSTGTSSTMSAPAQFVRADGSDLFVGDSGGPGENISSSSSQAQDANAAWPQGAPQPIRLVEGASHDEFGHVIVEPTITGIATLRGSSLQEFAAPTFSCPGGSDFGITGTTSTTSTTSSGTTTQCDQFPTSMGINSQGIWYVLSGPTHEVGVLPSSFYS